MKSISGAANVKKSVKDTKNKYYLHLNGSDFRREWQTVAVSRRKTADETAFFLSRFFAVRLHTILRTVAAATHLWSLYFGDAPEQLIFFCWWAHETQIEDGRILPNDTCARRATAKLVKNPPNSGTRVDEGVSRICNQHSLQKTAVNKQMINRKENNVCRHGIAAGNNAQ